jgi:hypothetical protein
LFHILEVPDSNLSPETNIVIAFICLWQEKYYEEYRLYELGDVASKLVAPLLKDRLTNWLPLQNPQEPMALFKQWKDLLEGGQSQTLSTMSTQDPYHYLVWQSWMPSVRTAVKYVQIPLKNSIKNLD